MRAVRRLRRVLALSGGDRRGLAAAWLALAVTDARLRALGFQRLLRRIERGRRFHAATPAEIARARRRAHWLDRASRHHIVGAHCLHRSLALHAALRRAGLESTLRIGVRKHDEALLAHAWVELAGEVVTDAPEAVAPFAALAPAAPLVAAGGLAGAGHRGGGMHWSGSWQ